MHWLEHTRNMTTVRGSFWRIGTPSEIILKRKLSQNAARAVALPHITDYRNPEVVVAPFACSDNGAYTRDSLVSYRLVEQPLLNPKSKAR